MPKGMKTIFKKTKERSKMAGRKPQKELHNLIKMKMNPKMKKMNHKRKTLVTRETHKMPKKLLWNGPSTLGPHRKKWKMIELAF